MRTTTPLAMLAVVAAAAAACGGHRSSGAAAHGTAAVTPGGRSGVPAEVPASPTGTGSPPPPTSTTAQAVTATPARPALAGSPTRSAAASPLPPAGSYGYTARGTATGPLGSHDLDGTGVETVDRARGGRQHSVYSDGNGRTDQTVVVDATGVRLADLHISQQGFDEDFRAASPVLLVPARPRVGRSWSWRLRSSDGAYTIDASLTVARVGGATTVAGRRVTTVTINGHLVITGSGVRMTIDQSDDVARGLPVVSEHAVVDGTAYGATFHSDSTRRLRSTPSG